MQATKTRHTGVSQRSGTDTDKRKRTVEHTGRTNGKSQKRAAINRSYANDFLKTKFETVPTIDLDPLFSENNYRYLYDSAANYSRLLGIDFKATYEPKNFRGLYDSFDKILKGVQLSLRDKDGSLYFCIDVSYDEGWLIRIPCKILDNTEGEFRNILLEFFRILKTVNNLTQLADSYHAYALFEDIDYQEELEEEGQEGEMDTDYIAMLKQYKDGDIRKTLDLVNTLPEYAPGELQEVIAKYIPKNKKEEELLATIYDGLELMLSEIPIFNYVGTPDFESDSGFIPMSADELYMIVYDRGDYIITLMNQSINEYCGEGGSQYFTRGLVNLEPDTEELYSEDPYPKAFLDWTEILIDKLVEYDNK